MILYPRNEKKPEKKPQVKETTLDKLQASETKVQNILKVVIQFPKKVIGNIFALITDGMKKANAYQIQRKEIKPVKGFYMRLERIKAKVKKNN